MASGAVALVTGAGSGIGREIARGLARRGDRVVLLCRSADSGEPVRRALAADTGNASLELLTADLRSLAAVRAAAAEFRARHDRLDVLVANAGVSHARRAVTADGLEETVGVNHFAHFLLANLLLEPLRASPAARVVVVSSKLHADRLDFDNLQGERRYTQLEAYARSKLMNLLFTFELARRLAGTAVTANAVHPGGVRTRIYRDLPWWLIPLMPLGALFLDAPATGARGPLRLATDPGLSGVTGRYFDRTAPAEPRPIARDESVARRLWDVSAGLVGL